MILLEVSGLPETDTKRAGGTELAPAVPPGLLNVGDVEGLEMIGMVAVLLRRACAWESRTSETQASLFPRVQYKID